MNQLDGSTPASLSIVVPVYQGEHTLRQLAVEVDELRTALLNAEESAVRITELVLVHDNGPDGSATVMQELAETYSWVQPVWLTRNFGQHPATVAGIASSSGDWIVTMDEDGLHNPADIPTLVAHANAAAVPLVYGQSENRRPHSWFRNFTSRLANIAFRLLVGTETAANFASFRLLDGPTTRGLVAYCGHGVYLDVALSWVMPEVGHCDVTYREEIRPAGQGSGYGIRSLLSHFRRLVVTSGTRPLRAIAVLGLISTIAGLAVAFMALMLRFFGDVETQGWASVIIAITVFSGLIMMALGVVAEYLSVAVTMATGRPMYMTRNRPPGRVHPGS